MTVFTHLALQHPLKFLIPCLMAVLTHLEWVSVVILITNGKSFILPEVVLDASPLVRNPPVPCGRVTTFENVMMLNEWVKRLYLVWAPRRYQDRVPLKPPNICHVSISMLSSQLHNSPSSPECSSSACTPPTPAGRGRDRSCRQIHTHQTPRSHFCCTQCICLSAVALAGLL